MRCKVYIINSPDDDGIASTARQLLEANEVSCLCPPSRPVRYPEGQVKKLIHKSDLVVLILSTAAYSSARVKQEVEWAARTNKIIIPFRIDSAPLAKYLELYLGIAHWLDATTPHLDQHLAQLVSTVRRLLGLEKGYPSLPATIRGRRAAKKAIASLIFGVLGILDAHLIFALLGIILGRLELKAIAARHSPAAGRRYARAGVICGWIGIVLGAANLFLILYMGVDWVADIIGRMESLIWPTPLGPR